MDDDAKQTEVAERLRSLQAKHGLTIQQMADRCGLPKRSLENYMKMKDPQRPGLDALMGIADGFGVSIDWIVGRSEEADTGEFSKEDYALFCQSVVMLLLHRILDAVKEDPARAIDVENDLVTGCSTYNIAGAAMLDFLRIVDLQRGNLSRPLGYGKQSFARRLQDLRDHGLAETLDSLSERKP